jgi:methionyl-tRNA synthetase
MLRAGIPMASRFYVTTPIYYINDVPHLGSAYTTIAADVLARYHRLRGHETRFQTGTDEHGLKIQRVAAERGIAPQAHADEIAEQFRATWPRLGCQPDDFIRTTEARHKAGAQKLWTKIRDNGHLYLGHYEGLYCVSCEGYYTEKELNQPGNICPTHGRPAEMVREESYFFRLSKFGDRLLAYYDAHDTVRPAGRLNEVKSFVQAGLEDLSVSRTTFDWGVPVPDDPRHVMYVWFDALSNYYTALQSPEDNLRFWPAVHLLGKDILRFHAVYWPAMLMAAGIEPPAQVFAHGFLTYNGQKMGKTLRNTISPVALAEAISPSVGVDTVRYALMRAISFGQDGDFSIENVLQRYSSELGNQLGNLLNRVLPFAGEVPAKGATGALEEKLAAAHAEGAAAAAKAFDEASPTKALDAIWGVLAAANDYVDKAAPWAAKKSGDAARLGTIMATLVEELEAVSLMIAPVLPAVADAMREQIGLGAVAGEIGIGKDQWPFALPRAEAGRALKKGAPLFPRLEKEREAEIVKEFSPAVGETATTATETATANATATATATANTAASTTASANTTATATANGKATIAYDDFAKIDLKVGVVTAAERVKKKDKLLDLKVDVGEGAPRRIVAGIAAAYAPEQILGKRVVVLCNLAPRDFGKGLVSEGMLLAAEDEGGLRVVTVDGEKAAGSSVK